jgi:polyisoprenyl-teichoic acid--peptidoglycan teichoic acid transferase
VRSRPADPRRPSSPRWPALAEQRRFRRALLLLGLTLVLPGSAQIAAGSRRVGRRALLGFLGLVGLGAAVVLLVPTATLAGWLVRSEVLTLVRVLAVVLAGGWVALFVDAWRLGRPPSLTRQHRQVAVGLTVALCLAVAVPLGYAAHYAKVMRDDVVGLFPEGAAAPVDGRLNVLLLGGDAAPGREGVRTDSVHLVSVDVASGRPVMFSLPRNLENARFPDGTPLDERFPRGFRSDVPDDPAYLLNAVYTYGVENPALVRGAADPGAEAVKQAVSGTLGLPVHYYVLVNLFGFRDMVDALGGVTLTVREDVPYTVAGKDATIHPGSQHLDGRQTLIYARSRTGSSDYARMGRQRCLLGAILQQADPVKVLRNFEGIAGSAKGVVSTDIPRETLPDLVDVALKAKASAITTVQFVPPLISAGSPDIGAIQAKVASTLARSERRDAPVRASAPAASARPSGPPAAAGTGRGGAVRDLRSVC